MIIILNGKNAIRRTAINQIITRPDEKRPGQTPEKLTFLSSISFSGEKNAK